MDNFPQIEERIATLEKSSMPTFSVYPYTRAALWYERMELRTGEWLLSLWRNFCTGLRIPEHRSEYRAIPGYGYTQEVADGLRLTVNAKPSFRDFMPEECSFTLVNDDGFAFPMPGEERTETV